MEYSDSVTGSPNDSCRTDLEGVEYNNESPGLGVDIDASKEFVGPGACEGLGVKERDERGSSGSSLEGQQGRSVAPYSRFLVLLKDKLCSEIVFFVAKFIQQYPRLDEGLLDLIYGESKERLDLEEAISGSEDIGTETLASILHSFVGFCGNLLQETGVFRGVVEEERTFIIEGLEKLVTTKLYNVLFDAVSFENDDVDHYLFRKLKVLKTFVKLDHFDISKLYIETLQSDSLWLEVCRNELYKFIRVKSPKDKVVLIVNICKILLSYMNNISKMRVSGESSGSGEERVSSSPPAADDLLPLLIFCIIQSNPAKLKAHVEFISLFRSSALLVSEDLYFFTHFYSAVTFLEKLDGRQIQLNMETSSFEEQFRSSERKLFGSNLLHLLAPYSDSRASYQERQGKIQEITGEISSLNLTLQDCNSPDELRVGDIPKLFQEYKQLLKLFKELKQHFCDQ